MKSTFINLIPFLLIIILNIQQNDPKFPKLTGPYLGQTPPGMTPEIFASGIISTEDNIEFAGTFSPDLTEYFFTRRKKDTIENRIFYTRIQNGQWTKPELAPFAYDCFEFEPHITPKGDKLFFGSKRPLPGSKLLNRRSYIWISTKTGEGWSPPEYLGPPFDDAMFVCVSDDETMYNSGITKSEPINGKYGPWEKIASHIYGPYMHPCISPNEEYIIFDTDRPFKGLDKGMFISFRKNGGSWGEIISFRKVFDFEGLFGIPMLSPDGKYLFFSFQGNIYWVDAKIISILKK